MNDQAFLEAKIAGLENEVRQFKETLRDRFAMAALPALIQVSDSLYIDSDDAMKGMTIMAYQVADAMLEARKS